MNELNYPFQSELLLRKRKSIKEQLLANMKSNCTIKVAVLCGSSAKDIVDIMELFLLNYGIKPEFYLGEYNRVFEEAVFDNELLDVFNPDIVYIYVSSRNIKRFPSCDMEKEEVSAIVAEEYEQYIKIWESLRTKYNCTIVQNNFEMPIERNWGNMDPVFYNGRLNFTNSLNELFYKYARENDYIKICDINFVSASYGLKEWSDPKYWYLYKYALNPKAIPELSYNVAVIIKSIYGKNKKCIVVDLDNTLWGGVIAEDGVDNLQVGEESAEGEMYLEFQKYIKKMNNMGVLLGIASKNSMDMVEEGFNNPYMLLKMEDFSSIKADFNRKDKNIVEIADDLNILPESIVFIDDNPAELKIVNDSIDNISVISSERCEHVIPILDRSGFFEIYELTDDDKNRNAMLMADKKRKCEMKHFADYGEYLKSLDMKAEISTFSPGSLNRITQLTNKSNQFNLTTHRYRLSEIEEISKNKSYLAFYGKLSDCFGDNGIVSVVIGSIKDKCLNIDLWLMSCRVLKRDMEFAMFDYLIQAAKKKGIALIRGEYIPTPKNEMVKDFYRDLGFALVEQKKDGRSIWEKELDSQIEIKNKYIKVDSIFG